MQSSTSQQLSELERVAALAGEPRNLSAAGVTRTEQRIATIENDSPFDPSSNARRRLVVVADNDRAASATLAAIRWFKTDAPRGLRDSWNVSAVLLSSASDATPAQQLEFPPAKGFFDHPDQPESRYLWRWVAYQAPDVLLQVRGGDVLSRSSPPAGSLAAAMAGGSEMGTVHAIFGSARETDGPALLEHALKESAGARESEVHATLRARASREPLAIARVLAGQVPAESTRQLHPIGGLGQYASACGPYERRRAAAESAERDATVGLPRAAAVWRTHCADRCRRHVDLRRSGEAGRRAARVRWRYRAPTRP